MSSLYTWLWLNLVSSFLLIFKHQFQTFGFIESVFALHTIIEQYLYCYALQLSTFRALFKSRGKVRIHRSIIPSGSLSFGLVYKQLVTSVLPNIGKFTPKCWELNNNITGCLVQWLSLPIGKVEHFQKYQMLLYWLLELNTMNKEY